MSFVSSCLASALEGLRIGRSKRQPQPDRHLRQRAHGAVPSVSGASVGTPPGEILSLLQARHPLQPAFAAVRVKAVLPPLRRGKPGVRGGSGQSRPPAASARASRGFAAVRVKAVLPPLRRGKPGVRGGSGQSRPHAASARQARGSRRFGSKPSSAASAEAGLAIAATNRRALAAKAGPTAGIRLRTIGSAPA